MEVSDYIRSELENLDRTTTRVLEGISYSEATWRPGPGCNSIALILYHSARFEDMIQSKVINNREVWETEKWYEKLKLPPNDIGVFKTAEEVAAFSVPSIKDLQDYYKVVRIQALSAVKSITPERLDQVIHLPFGEFSVSAMFVMTVSHQSQHIGEMSYLRGLQRGMNK
jgi:hypothetical protein